MNSFDEEIDRYYSVSGLLDLLYKLNIKNLEDAHLENQRRHNWATVAQLMGSMEMNSFYRLCGREEEELEPEDEESSLDEALKMFKED